MFDKFDLEKCSLERTFPIKLFRKEKLEERKISEFDKMYRTITWV